MRLFRFRLRTLMIAVAVLAPLLAAVVFLLRLSWALDNFYGPDGVLALKQRISAEVTAGDERIKEGKFVEAEARLRTAIRMQADCDARSGSRDGDAWFAFGLADALAGQGRTAEADLVYRKCLAVVEAASEPENTSIDHFLMRYATFLRGAGRASEAEQCETRAVAALDRSAAHFRRVGRVEVAEALEARSRAIGEGACP
jgi:tetratricopeptide (TPR) repeat protein